ncbi:rhomboid family intramembrane serine protease [Aeromicrobium phragmitis]|uniref:Rhomboid family intramembrane serine protease n=1 Tax=Aeromicrobium phragmitis TaxID=2478914 RepID=A0A3L8PPI9_9ACTN|nr:rhomboid family intramembrane serine protease [Aeromicrobium phragmitis]RLV57306.1 rhomboid family intramembrane serine protease [Aeromicrobium phragmitis]
MTQPPPHRCYRHPDRDAYIQCQRCERFICPDDMREASVGFQCPECVASGRASVRQPRTAAGGAISLNAGAVTTVIIGLNVIVHVLAMLTGGSRGPVFREGAMVGVEVAYQEEYWRLLTSAFLHGSLLHLGFNMLALYLFGPFVEGILGRWRFIATYLTLAVSASAFVYWLASPMTATIGASGAVFGMFGLALIFLIRQRQNITGMLVLLAINGLISLQAGISWQGHLGGFLTGCVLGAVFAWAPRERRTFVQVTAFAVLWIVIVAAVVLRSLELVQPFMPVPVG